MHNLQIGPRFWKKIVYWSRKYTVVRVFGVTWITVYLLCLHTIKSIVNSSRRQRTAFAMALCMIVTSLPCNMAMLNAEVLGESEISTEVPEDIPENPYEEPEDMPENPYEEPEDMPENPADEPERMEWNYDELIDYSQLDLTGDAVVTIPDYELDLGYTNPPVYLFSLTNPDEAEWSSLQVNTSLAELHWVELVEEEEQVVEASELEDVPEVLEAHEQVYFVLVFPLDMPVGRTVEILQIHALSSPMEEGVIPENIDVGIELGMNVTDIQNQTPEEIVDPVEEPEKTPDVLPEEPEESVTPEEPADDETGDAGQKDELPAEEEPVNIPFEEPYVLETHPDGYFLGSAFFVQGGSEFVFTMNQNSIYANQKMICKYGESIVELENQDGKVHWGVPEEFTGLVSFGYYDEEQTYHEVLNSFLVREKQKPVVQYHMADNDSQKLIIDISEEGTVASGVNEYKVYLDGQAVDEIGTANIQQSNISEDCTIMTSLTLEVNLPAGGHDIEIVATDCCGNTAIETFSMEIQPNDCICVVLPTTFDLKINPMLEKDQIHSQDITICNKSAFDLDVSVTTVDMYVDKTIPENVVSYGSFNTASEDVHTLTVPEKGCNVDMTIRTCGDVEQKLPLQEGMNTMDAHFRLGKGNPATDAQQLMRDSNGGHVDSTDYAIVNFKGMLYENNERLWDNGDLVIKVVFRFERAVE